MFFTTHELPSDANLFEMFLWFSLNVTGQVLLAMVLSFLLVYVLARTTYALTHYRPSLGSFNSHEFAIWITVGTYGGMASFVALGYWDLLPPENQWIGIVICLPMFLIGVMFLTMTFFKVQKLW